MSKGHLTIVSCGVSPENLTSRHREAIENADVLAGGRRLLDWFPEFPGEVTEIGRDAADNAAELAIKARDHRVTVLASGDALFFGIARRFVSLLPETDITILPNITAAQAALAQLRIPWESARFLSVHGRPTTIPWGDILRASPAVVYGDSVRTPVLVAKELVAQYPECAEREAAVIEDLGGANLVRRATLRKLACSECGGLSMLILFGPGSEGSIDAPSIRFGAMDDTYVHDGRLITHPEIRAVVLSKLRIGPGVLWDLGAGSGSVGIEAGGLCRGVTVYAVEKNGKRCRQIEDNARRAGLADINVVQDDIRQAMPRLPCPQGVFIGGGGQDIADIVTDAFGALRPGGRLVAVAVLLETRRRLDQVLVQHRLEMIEIEVRRLIPVARSAMLKPDNPVSMFVFEKPRS